jgi:hypothetical protein
MLTVVSGRAQDFPYCFFSTSPEHSITGIQRSLFEIAGLGRSTGKVPDTIGGMAKHALAFLDWLGLKTCDVLGFSLGGMVAQQMRAGPPLYFSADDTRWHGTPRWRRHHAPR